MNDIVDVFMNEANRSFYQRKGQRDMFGEAGEGCVRFEKESGFWILRVLGFGLQQYTIVVSILFSIIPILPQYTIVVSIFFSIIPI